VIQISSIPDSGFSNPFSFRVVIAVAAVIAMFIGCFYLTQSFGKAEGGGVFTPVAVRGCWLLVVMLYLFQLLLICRYMIDIPYYEEWEFFDNSALPQGLSWQWLTHQISHQRMMLFTKFMAWLNFKLFSLDFVKLKIMNYMLFGGLIVSLVRLKIRIVGRNGFDFFPLFIVFLLSTIVYEVHIASFQSGETFVVMLSLVMIGQIIQAEPTYKGALIFSGCAVLAMYSLSAGFVYAVIFLITGTLFTVVRICNNSISRSMGLRFVILNWCLVASSIAMWIYGYKKPDAVWGVPEWLLPVEVKFWKVYLDLLSYGFGFETEHPLPGIICLIIVLTPVILLLIDRKLRWQTATWQVTTAITGTLAVIGLLAVGRGNMPFSIKVSRYAIFAYLLIPYAAIAWWLVLRTVRQRFVVLTCLWCFCAATYFNNWEFPVYRYIKQLELQNLECVENYYNNGGEGLCSGTHIFPIGIFFDNAKTLDIHFTRMFESPKDVKQ
jgi:hypothetical protein